MAQDYEINVKVKGIDQAKGSVDDLTDSMEDAGTAGTAAIGGLDRMLGGLPSKFKAAIAGIRGMIVGMKTLRGAVISTGIGALVVAVGSLLAYFQRTERGSQELRVAMATLGGVVDALMDNVIHLGEFLVKAFKDPGAAMQDFANMIRSYVVEQFQKIIEGAGMVGEALMLLFEGEFSQAADVAAAGFAKISDGALHLAPPTAIAAIALDQIIEKAPGIAKTAEAAGKLEMRMNALMVQERDHLKVRAETNKLIAEQRLLVEDEALSYDERIAALDRAIAAEISAVDEELRMAKERAEILKQQAALAESDEETKRQVAEAEARVLDIETQSLKMRKRLEGERQTLILQRTAETEAAEKAITDAIEKEAKEREKIEADSLKRRLENEKKAEEQRAELMSSARSTTFDLLRNLNSAFERDTEEAQKKAFRRNKALNLAETIISTYAAAQKAYASQLAIPTPDAPIRASVAAGVAVAAGLAKVAAIASQRFDSGQSTGAAAGGAAVGGGAVQSVGVDVGTLVPTAGQPTPEPVRAYVVSNEISNKQALDRELQIQTTL